MKRTTGLTLGLIIDWMGTDYHRDLLNGFTDYCEDHGLSSQIYVTGRLNSPWKTEQPRNILLDFTREGRPDGLVLASASLCNLSGTGVLEEMLPQLKSHPCVTLGDQLPGIPFIHHNNREGMSLLMDHLIEVHSYTRFAFIRGGEGNEDGERRFQIFREKLEEKELDIRPEYIFPGMFRDEDGYNAVTSLLGGGLEEIDVLVCSNDTQALGALRALRENNIPVPQKLAVVGYDDMVYSRYRELTTVRQSFEENGRRAAELCHKQLLGKKVKLKQHTPPRLILRQTCGCNTDLAKLKPLSAPTETFHRIKKKDSPVTGIMEEILCTSHTEKELLNIWLSEFFDQFCRETSGKKEISPIELWCRIINRTQGSFALKKRVARAGNYLMASMIELLPQESPWRIYWRNVAEILRTISEKSIQADLYCKKTFNESRIDDLMEMSERLIGENDFALLLDLAVEYFPSLGVDECYVCLFEDRDNPMSQSRLIMAYRGNRRFPIGTEGILFPTERLLPDEFYDENRTISFLVQALFTGKEKIGYILFDTSNRDWRAMEALREKFSFLLQPMI
ncbi:MAG: LacI family DNA-binding transcriptional regulator [Spirochaetales bacterium]|nr:LacI family DNA-binding transcriptional regulator [Spirochaetales bacterium]